MATRNLNLFVGYLKIGLELNHIESLESLESELELLGLFESSKSE